MFIDIDYDKRKKGYKINLAKPNQQTIASISEAYGANYSIKLGNINEVTFNVPYFIDKLDERVKNENIELIKEKMYTKISYNNNDEWMVIDSIEDAGSGDEKYMTVTAFTNVYETSNRKINELNLEVVNPEEYYDEVLNDVAWTIGTIDPLFKDIYRSVELSNVTVLEAIITGAETFGAVLDFDTENKKINLIDIDSRAKYRGLNINYSNFLQSINRKRSVDEMTTRLYVYGSEDLSIENVNPTGMRYLEDFTYFLYPFERDENKNVIQSSHYMSDELAHAILDKNELSEEYQPLIQAMQEEIDEETIEYINETTLLNELRFDEMSVSGLLDIAKATGDNDLILQRQGELAEIKTKISIKELIVDHIDATIEDLERQISQLQSQISVTSFSKELYDELSMCIIESEFRDDRYIDEEELYRDALKKFDESKSPSVVIEASIDNIIDSLEEDYYSDKVVLGDIARVTDKEMSIEMKSLIVELSFDLDNNTCDVTIANGDIEKDGYDRILSVLYDTQSTTTMLENNKHKWDTVTDVKTEVDLMRDGEIDATRNRIKAGFRESVTIEDRGIILSNPDFPNEIVIMQAGVIALSTDGGENWSTSITPRGVMADTIIGRLVASNNLTVTNDSGSFRIDGDGLTVDMDSIKIMSGEGDTPENIVDSWNKMLITMDEFADDGKLNEYEKNQIARQWNSIAIAHSSMVDAIQNAYGPETPENPYPAEYEVYMESYERLRSYLNDEIQSDGHTILDPLHRGETTDIDSNKYNGLVSDYEVNKDRFQTVIPLEFSQTFMEQTRHEISLNYVKNGEVATKLNLSEEGIRIDGRLLEINSETHFNDDLVMNAGLIRSADGAINIDLNAGVINLARPLTINAVPVATERGVEDAIQNIKIGGRNLVIRNNEVQDTYISNQSTFPNPEPDIEGYSTISEPISVVAGESLYFSKNWLDSWSIAWLDEEFNQLAHEESADLSHVIVPDGASFLWVSYPTNERVQIERGNKATEWTLAPEDIQANIDAKTNIETTNAINERLGDFITKEVNDEKLGEITTALNDYLALVDQTRSSVYGLVDDDGNPILDENGKPIQEGITKEVEKLLDRAVAIENNLEELSETWNFDVTQITMAEEGMFVGSKGSDMGILIAPDRVVNGELIKAGIYFMDGGNTIAFISGQMMQINRGIFVQSATIGEHKIETIAGGHTIWSWIPS